jgi:hypothetical protein
MTYRHEEVFDKHTHNLDVWETNLRAHPDCEWLFPEPHPGLTSMDVDKYRSDMGMAAGANQIYLRFREGSIYVSQLINHISNRIVIRL